jgi:hypothetical protein
VAATITAPPANACPLIALAMTNLDEYNLYQASATHIQFSMTLIKMQFTLKFIPK